MEGVSEGVGMSRFARPGYVNKNINISNLGYILSVI